jgi:anti-sigma regulatory factor (Ser/Thr protein kinase)
MRTIPLTVPATLDSLAPIATYVLAAADEAGLDRRARYRLRLSVDELASNIIMHGCAEATDAGVEPAPIELRAEIDDKTLTVTIEDSGAPFDPSDVPPPDDLHLPAEQRKIGGLGVYLALQGVDHFSYDRIGARNRTTLVVNRPQAPSQQAPGSAGG